MVSSIASKGASIQQKYNFQNSVLNETPILRIGLTENKEIIEFKSSGRFSVFNNEGITILKNVSSPTKWRIKIEQSYSAKYNYNILLGKFVDIQLAQELTYELIEKGLGARIKTLGEKLYYKNKIINDNSQYWVILDNFANEQEAESFARQVLHNYEYKIIKEKIKEPGAILQIFDSEFEKLSEVENAIRIIPELQDMVSYVFDLSADNGLQWKTNKYRAFRGILEFRSNDAGKLTIINETPLEKYIEGVLAVEMKSDFPVEALRAYAITIRSKTIANLQIKHYSDPYDLCTNSHCQVFTGLSRTSENIINAVHDTMGQVLIHNKKIFNAYHTLVCGGCTDKLSILDAEIINELDTNVFDLVENKQLKGYQDLSNEQNVRRWIDANPVAYCNLAGSQLLSHLQKYFRWEISYHRKELEEIISEKEGKMIGTLYDIIPRKRSISGRLLEIEIIASNRNLVIEGEINIRKILGQSMLNSSCFYIVKELDDDGIPYTFTIRGAGYGHGVGMCQAGAVAMAQKGYTYQQILSHYFKKTKIKKIY